MKVRPDLGRPCDVADLGQGNDALDGVLAVKVRCVVLDAWRALSRVRVDAAGVAVPGQYDEGTDVSILQC